MYEVTKAIGINPKKYILASLLRFDIFDFILEIIYKKMIIILEKHHHIVYKKQKMTLTIIV